MHNYMRFNFTINPHFKNIILKMRIMQKLHLPYASVQFCHSL